MTCTSAPIQTPWPLPIPQRQDISRPARSNNYSPPETLAFSQTYYWRVDEYNTDATITKGRVWSFTIADYLVVDDMESYGGADTLGVPGSRIWYTWNDGSGWTNPTPGNHGNGSGAIVDVSTTTVNSGAQSMRLEYRNDGVFTNAFAESKTPYYSEVKRTFDTPQDWTRKGVKALMLWFYGGATNSAAPLYVAVTDNTGATTGKVTYPVSVFPAGGPMARLEHRPQGVCRREPIEHQDAGYRCGRQGRHTAGWHGHSVH